MKYLPYHVYHHASERYLPRYVDEFTLSLNEGGAKRHTAERLASLVSALFGSSISYKALTA